MFERVRLRRAGPTAVATDTRSARPRLHRRIENLVLAIFWVLVFEGALRKWVAPQFSQFIFFIRDPLVLLVYWYALRASVFRSGGPFLQIGLLLAVVAM